MENKSNIFPNGDVVVLITIVESKQIPEPRAPGDSAISPSCSEMKQLLLVGCARKLVKW